MADKKVSLRAGALPSMRDTPQVTSVDMPGLRGTLPYATGHIGDSHNIPAGVQEEVRRFNEAPIITPEAEKRKAITPKGVVQLESLPEEKQKEVMQSVRAAMEREPSRTPFIPRGPGIGQAKAMADRAAAQTEERLKRAQEKPQDQWLPPKPETKAAPVEVPSDQLPELPPQPELPDTGICVHCGFPRGTKEWCNPTRADKQIFVAAVLGQKRFSKEYNLLGGQLKIVFRTLTVIENDLVVKQLMCDWNDGLLSGPAHSVAEATKYQLTMALESIETNVGPLTLPALDEYDYDEPEKGTILPKIVAHVSEVAMPNEHVRRIVSKVYGHFIETQSKLEAMAENADFWLATEG